MQVHKDGDRVEVWSRALNVVTPAVPEVVEAVRLAPDPVRIPAQHRRAERAGAHERWVVPGVDEAVAASAERLRTFSELGLPWAGGRRG